MNTRVDQPAKYRKQHADLLARTFGDLTVSLARGMPIGDPQNRIVTSPPTKNKWLSSFSKCHLTVLLQKLPARCSTPHTFLTFSWEAAS